AAPEHPSQQLGPPIESVFPSWDSPRAVAYRAHHGLDESDGTAVVVQAMVFGNINANSGAGVVFSRNPMTGANEEFGEWLLGGQGDEGVWGPADVEPIAALHSQQPGVYDQLISAASSLERLSADVQEVEFTIQDGTLWLLPARGAQRAARAAGR